MFRATVILLLALFTLPALADNGPAGTWKTVAAVKAMQGSGDHDLGDLAKADPVPFTLTLQAVDGRAYEGRWCGPKDCEDVVGVARSGGDMVLVDNDGIFLVTPQDGALEVCYLEPGTEFRIAVCHTMTRQDD